MSYKTYSNLLDSFHLGISGNTVSREYFYDALERVVSVNTHTNSRTLTESYTYVTNGYNTTSLVATHTVNGVVYAYTYDDVGNILTISENETLRYHYTYDKLGQLRSANHYSDAYYTSNYYDIYEYAYDKAGNIASVGHHYGEGISNSEFNTYTYGNETWGDLLTNYNGTSITYDTIGNPLNWRNATSLTWQGRRLTAMVVNGTAMSFEYNSDGIRQSKTYGNTTVNYITDGSKIIAEYSGNTYTYYIYDESGTIMGMMYNNQLYTFRKNLQGDVTGIYTANGTLVAKYQYSPYGEILAITDGNGNNISANASHIANVNPFRYRGYYYDTETGFYYLNSRYYDPVVGRFLNADAILGANGGIVGYNSFAYCNNNPIMFSDNSGYLRNYNVMLTDTAEKGNIGVGKKHKEKEEPGFWEEFFTDMSRPRSEGNTCSVGISAGVSFGGVSTSNSGVISVDTSYNYALQETTATGAATGIGASCGIVMTYTNATDVQDLAGQSSSYGFSFASPIGISIDFLEFESASNPGKSCWGVSVCVSFGGEVEFHGADNNTNSTRSWNLFGALKNLFFGE